MQRITTLTQKGQVTIPKQWRDILRMKAYGRVIVIKEENAIKILPTRDILDLAGTFQPKKKKSVLRARKTLEKTYTRI